MGTLLPKPEMLEETRRLANFGFSHFIQSRNACLLPEFGQSDVSGCDESWS